MGIPRNPNRNAAPAAGGGYMRSAETVAATSMRDSGVKAWTPTVANLLVLVLLELVAFALLRYLLRTLQR